MRSTACAHAGPARGGLPGSDRPGAHRPGPPERLRIRAGDFSGTTAGLAPGNVQANLVILPKALAHDFLRFAQYPLWRVTPYPTIENGKLVEVFDMRFGTPLAP